jgi:hypothetical protein
MKRENEEARNFATADDNDWFLNEMILRRINYIVAKIVLWVTKELAYCVSLTSREKIVKKLFQHEVMATLLPKYYPRLHEAKM